MVPEGGPATALLKLYHDMITLGYRVSRPSTIWVPEIEFWLSGLVAIAFIQIAISLAPGSRVSEQASCLLPKFGLNNPLSGHVTERKL